MLNFEELARKRRSIRKFESKDIDVSEIIECVKNSDDGSQRMQQPVLGIRDHP